MKKYKLTKTKKEYSLITLYQIEALRDFGNIKKGDKGGWIEKEDNLSQEDNAWVFGNAKVYNLKTIGGHFYHYKQKPEQIEHIEVNKGYELLAKEPKLEEEAEKEDTKEDTIEIKVEGKTKRISRLSAKELNLI
jgi:hypothetical protein